MVCAEHYAEGLVREAAQESQEKLKLHLGEGCL